MCVAEGVRSDCGAAMQETAILSRSGLDFRAVKIEDPAIARAGRVSSVVLEVPGRVQFLLCAVYLADKVGLHESKFNLLASPVQLGQMQRKPLIVTGDFNLSPAKLLKSSCCTRAG